jgi:hypothetical protein
LTEFEPPIHRGCREGPEYRDVGAGDIGVLQARLKLVPYLETRTRAGVPGRGTDLELADLRLRPELAQSSADREVRFYAAEALAYLDSVVAA